ncbi:MAG: hypothetical protein IJD07_00470 [Clostridia bacterium]|nr:hypothetical protein [Clostridia bacterium]
MFSALSLNISTNNGHTAIDDKTKGSNILLNGDLTTLSFFDTNGIKNKQTGNARSADSDAKYG